MSVIPPLEDDRNKFIVWKGFSDKYFDKFSLKYEDLTLSGIDPDVFDPTATTNNLLAFLKPKKMHTRSPSQKNLKNSVSKQIIHPADRPTYDPIKPIRGRLVKLLKGDIKRDQEEYHNDLHKRTYKKIRQ